MGSPDQDVSDRELLRRYAAARDVAAFERLVARHLGWVSASARRQVADPATADDVTQAAFILLARKPPKLREGLPLTPWLFRALRNLARTATRNNQRRRSHEGKAAMIRPEVRHDNDDTAHTAEWEMLAPHLDQMVARLNETDRRAVLLRYFERRPLADVARALGTSEEAARKRVDRAVAKLRDMATRRGLAVPATTSIAALLLAHTAGSAQPASAATVADVSTAALSAVNGAGVASAGALTLAGAVGWPTSALVTLKVAAAVIVGAMLATGTYVLITRNPARPFVAQTAATVIATPVQAPSRPAPTTQNTRMRVGYVVSKLTVTGPGRAFNGNHYTHAHGKVIPALADPPTEFWAVLEPGTQDDPDTARIVETVFGGRWLHGESVQELETCKVIVAAAVRNSPPDVLTALETAVRDGGVGLLIWIPIGGNSPGIQDPSMRHLNALADAGEHSGSFSLDWEPCEVVGSHPILGKLSGQRGTAVKFRPESIGGLDPTATPLVRLIPNPKQDAAAAHMPEIDPIYVSTLGKGRIVHFGFATFTQIPRDFDKAVGGHFARRCINWLAGGSGDLITTTPTTRDTHEQPATARR